ncbi:kinase-regulated stress-responsive transcription factor skn7 [Serendipita sp. 407]|nr:kinase-regulated stress-responsive transcription factor skn7 [Serendipita sp. 407]
MNGYGTSNVTMDMDINVNSFRRLQQHEILHHPLTRVPTTMNRNHPELRPRYPTQLQTADVSTADNQLPDLQLSTALSTDAAEDGMPAASDFVRKLFRMLEDPAFSNIVCWGSQRDCFIVKDMTEFTKVSQSKSPTDPSSSKDIPVAETAVVSDLQTQIDGLLQTQHDLKSHIITLETNYRSVLDEMATFQRGMASQDALIQNLLQHLINYEQPRSGDPALTKPLGTLETNFVSEEAQRMMSTSNYNPEDVARASLQQLTELSRRANRVPAGSGAHSNIRITTSNIPQHGDLVRSETHPRLQPSETGIPASTTLTSPSTAGPSLDWSSHKGLQVLTVGHLLPRAAHASTDEMEIEEQVMPSTTYSNSTQGPGTRLRVRRKTYVPGWAVPPRVLLVEDDAVSRKLSSKFLQVLGVTADIAVDGDAAVKQMCLERYDLVLMVCRPCSTRRIFTLCRTLLCRD